MDHVRNKVPTPTRRQSKTLVPQSLKTRRSPPLATKRVPRTDRVYKLTLELACIHSDSCFSLLSQQHPRPGLFVFLYLNKTCFILSAIHLWNLSWVSQGLGGYWTTPRQGQHPEQKQCSNTKNNAAWIPTLAYLSQKLTVLVFSALYRKEGREISTRLWKYRRGLVSVPTFKMLETHHSCLYNNNKRTHKLKINLLNLPEKWGHRENCHSEIWRDVWMRRITEISVSGTTAARAVNW